MGMKLFPFQQECVDKVGKLPYCLIADEMGCGKSYEAVARDQKLRTGYDESRKTLVICPLSVSSMWAKLFESEGYKVSLCDPKKRKDFLDIDGAAVYVVHFAAVRLLQVELGKTEWYHVIVDECQMIQNRKAQITTAVKSLKATNKTALSGTPVTNTPDKFWSILNWLDPKTYSSYWRFRSRYVKEEVDHFGYKKILGPKNVEQLQQEIAPFYIRRKKEDVLKDLPSKYYTPIAVDLHNKQQRAYDRMKKNMTALVGVDESTLLAAPIVVAQLTRLQQFSCAFADIDPDTGKVFLTEPSSKVDALMDIIESTDRTIVVFSQFGQMVNLISARLKLAGISHCCYTGKTPKSLRPSMIDKFQAGEYKVFVGTIAAGGVGITLTAASTVVFTDRCWSPADNTQAEDRLHRIGQKSAVQVVDIIGRGTVDLGRRTKLKLKASWLRALLDGELQEEI